MFVWNKNHIAKPAKVDLPILRSEDYSLIVPTGFSVAIIGTGPKGLYSLAALQHKLSQEKSAIPIEVHLFNSHPYIASGPNYSPDQPDFLLINYPVENINAWKEEEMGTEDKLSFIDWIANRNLTERAVQLGDFASRALVGLYLQDVLSTLIKNMPTNVTVLAFHAEVTSCHLIKSGKALLQLDHKFTNEALNYDSIMISTGHSFQPIPLIPFDTSDRLIKSIYPVEKKLNRITNTDSVAVAGLGLTFVDAILALTEGKGGRFEIEGEEIIYHSSGNEPKEIFAFSRSGLPMIPRSGKIPKNSRSKFLNKKSLNALKDSWGSIDFERDLLPLIKSEMEDVWYSSVINRAEVDVDWFKLFKFSTLFAPFQDQVFQDSSVYHYAVTKLLEYYIDELSYPPENSPLQQISAVWRNALEIVTECYNFGGFEASSMQDFQSNYLGRFNQISYGPPLISMKKIHCLMEMGLLKLTLGKAPHFRKFEEGSYWIFSPESGHSIKADYLVQATIPKSNFPERNSPLFQSLLQNGLARPFVKDSIQFKWPEINQAGNLVSKHGSVVSQITLYGTPTEGMTLDNDTLSRTRNDFANTWANNVAEELLKIKLSISHGNHKSRFSSTSIDPNYQSMGSKLA
ncbi:FAD/NAD(P)-binding protein [Algoriphagus antarcticus]|uniref:FAD-NAD(P)-binding protein n=1 Tax=Algoriphagus antarcticus TaxID=238540 RepID=A0A3E0DZ15_9BACT|nr:FAD/NAD(P)-binding protein [Algoriphagus antarcticus]REG90693.1 FAD-NAD(P)-binding protein [Algoriphagus antarcticus]